MHIDNLGYICMSGREFKMEIIAQNLDSWLSFLAFWVSFHDLSTLFHFSRSQQGVANILFYFLYMKQQEEKQMGTGICDQEDHESQMAKEELGAWCLKKNKSQIGVNSFLLVGAQAWEAFQARGVRHCVLLICSISFLNIWKFSSNM